MGVEIERKFLVHKHLLPDLQQGQRMIQGYLAQTPSVRYRVINRSMTVTIKEYVTGGERFELETPATEISETEILKLWQLSICPPVIKVRYRLPYAAQTDLQWEIDVYEGDNHGLITAEIEIPHRDYALQFPSWVDARSEVTEDSRYANVNLGSNPFRNWR